MTPQDFKLSIEGWQQLMTEFGLQDCRETYHMLTTAYAEKHRAYHTIEHIQACFRHLSAAENQASHPHEIELALWFHDVVYKPFSSTNEEDSAVLSKAFLAANGIAPDISQRIYDMIILTKDHVTPRTIDETLMIDIDLSILGAKQDTYDQFEKNVRKEYKWVPPFIFRKKREEVLFGFLARERLYHTDYFYNHLEAQAKANLERAVNVL